MQRAGEAARDTPMPAAAGDTPGAATEWTGDPSVTDPVVEAVMISTAAAQGISFTSRGRTLSRR